MDPFTYIKKEPYPLYINGAFVPSVSGEVFDIKNPYDNQVFAKAYKGGVTDVELAIKAAREAFDNGPWGKMSPRERGQLLLAARDCLAARREEFAVLETLDCGKLFPSAMYYELEQALDAFAYFAGKARNLEGKVVPIDCTCLNYVVWEPHGVVGEILPWNGPLMMGCQKVAAILAAGNTVVIKPSTWASLSVLALAEVFHEAGFPPGVVNVVTGRGGEIGNALVEHPMVNMVSMTGGTDTGRDIIDASKGTLKEIALELGGKSPNVIFEDVDLEKTARYARWAFTLNSGQVCVSGTRLLVQESIYEPFLAELAKACQVLVPGNGFEQGVNFSTLIAREHADSVWSYIEQGKKEGARLITGGVPYTDEKLAGGNFVPPTVFADVTPEMRIFQEEIFGPVLCVTPFKDEEEAISLANGTVYGLAGGVFTKDIKRGLRVAGAIKAGQIYVNSYFSKGMIESPGTGWKHSGTGVAGIHKYMTSKTIFVEIADDCQPQG